MKQITETEKETLLKLFNEYPERQQLKISDEENLVKRARQYLLQIHPFLNFVIMKDSKFKPLIFLKDEEIQTLQSSLDYLSGDVDYGKGKNEEKISTIVLKHSQDFLEIESLIYWLVSKTEKETSVNIKPEFHAKTFVKKEKPDKKKDGNL